MVSTGAPHLQLCRCASIVSCALRAVNVPADRLLNGSAHPCSRGRLGRALGMVTGCGARSCRSTAMMCEDVTLRWAHQALRDPVRRTRGASRGQAPPGSAGNTVRPRKGAPQLRRWQANLGAHVPSTGRRPGNDPLAGRAWLRPWGHYGIELASNRRPSGCPGTLRAGSLRVGGSGGIGHSRCVGDGLLQGHRPPRRPCGFGCLVGCPRGHALQAALSTIQFRRSQRRSGRVA
jgi:hypothetical protein